MNKVQELQLEQLLGLTTKYDNEAIVAEFKWGRAHTALCKLLQEITGRDRAWTAVPLVWGCEYEGNPVPYCVYDQADEEATCIYCGEPEERK